MDMQNITIRSQESRHGEPRVFFVVQNEAERGGAASSTELFPCPAETVELCSVLQSLTALPGDSPLPQTSLKSFRFWLHGLDSAVTPRSHEALLGAVEILQHCMSLLQLEAPPYGMLQVDNVLQTGHGMWIEATNAMQVAHFLGDERLPSWLQLAVNHLQSLLESNSDAKLVSNYVVATERLSMDVLDTLLEYLPLSTTLTHLSQPSHVRAIQVRVHQDEHGPHLVLEVNSSFSEEHACALTTAVKDLPDSLQPVTVTLKHGDQRNLYSSSLQLSDIQGSHCSEGLASSRDVQPALVHIAGILHKLPRLARLHCSRCCMTSSSLCLFPTEQLQVLNAADNDLGQRFSRMSSPSKRSFDECLVLTAAGPNTTLQELNLSANCLDAAMLPAQVSGVSHNEQYSLWNAPIQAAFARLQGLTSLDISCNNLTSSNIHTLLSPHIKPVPILRPGKVCTAPAPAPEQNALSTTGTEITIDSTASTSQSYYQQSRVADTLVGSDFNLASSGLKDRLQSLDIWGSSLTQPSPLVDTLRHLTALTRLNVADTALRTADMQELAPALMCMGAMRWLSIGSNRITQRAATALGRALTCMPDLERLDASGHIMFQFGSAGIETLAPVFGRLTALEHLDLRKQYMAADGIAAVTAHLSRLSHLTCIELDHNNLGLTGAAELALAVCNGALPSLQVLGLSSNKLSDEAMENLVPELLSLDSLRRVRVDQNPLAKWSGDWGTGSVGKDVLRRWLERDRPDTS